MATRDTVAKSLSVSVETPVTASPTTGKTGTPHPATLQGPVERPSTLVRPPATPARRPVFGRWRLELAGEGNLEERTDDDRWIWPGLEGPGQSHLIVPSGQGGGSERRHAVILRVAGLRARTVGAYDNCRPHQARTRHRDTDRDDERAAASKRSKHERVSETARALARAGRRVKLPGMAERRELGPNSAPARRMQRDAELLRAQIDADRRNDAWLTLPPPTR